MDPAEMTQRAADETGAFPARSQSGKNREAVIIPLAGNAFYAMVSAPPPPPLSFDNINAFGNFALPLLAWLLALVTAWLAMDRLVLRWLDYLGRIATLYASGKLTVQPLRAKQQAPFEINALADTLEEMAVRIHDRTNLMENALQARDAAMKEIHHRVKNNLQIINSLLSLQGRKLKDKAAIARELEYVFSVFPRLKEREKQISGTLSGGEQQMLAIGRALMSKPRFLMLDEPSLGIAPLLVKSIFEQIVKINRDQGLTILLVEQNANLALRVSSRGYVLETGKITLADASQALLADPKVRSAYLGG
jgi:ABC-type branched-subunit amino acid transport system ATPase component